MTDADASQPIKRIALSQPVLVTTVSCALALIVIVHLLVTLRGDVSLLLRVIEGSTSLVDRIIVFDLSIPRTLAGLAVGIALGLSGSVMQGLVRNPLADPGVLGVSAGAGLGAVIALYYGLAALSIVALPAMAMLGACVVTAVLLLVLRGETGTTTLVLMGLAMNALAGALTALVINLAPTPFTMNDMVLWLMGTLANRSTDDLLLALPFMLAGFAMLLSCGPGLRLLTLGRDVARSQGLNIQRLTLFAVVGTSLSVGAAVAISGTIGFVGLVVPHLLRALTGYDPARLVVPSALGGAALLLCADIAVQLLPTRTELQIGVMTALIGTPIFLTMLWSQRRVLP